MKLNRRTKIMAIGAAGAVVLGVGVGATIPTNANNAAADPQLASLMSARSPGMRSGAVASTKGPRVQPVAFAAPPIPKSEVLSERTPAVKVASAAPVPAVLAPVAAVPAPIPAPALAAAAPVLAIPVAPAAVAGGVSPLLGGLAAIPLVPAVFGGGGGGVTTLEIAPAVPEPATWLMMISGFGVLGFALRRRRRQQRTADAQATGAVAVAQRV